jgi:phage gp45-like
MMSNILSNGTVLPSGMLSATSYDMKDAHKKTFENYSVKTGIVVNTYLPSNSGNISKKVLEYDVLAFEQDGNKGSTIIKYRNCTVMSAFGSIADFFEANIRQMQTQGVSNTVPAPSGQNGSIVLILCVNGLSDKAVIIGCLSHPDRPTQLTDILPHLVFEYNGVNMEIKEDGSLTLTVNSATDNDGDVTTPIVGGPTTVSISSMGAVSISAPQQNVTVTCQNATITASDTAIVDGQTIKLGESAQQAIILGNLFQQYFNGHTHPTVFGASGAPIFPMQDNLLSTVSSTV